MPRTLRSARPRPKRIADAQLPPTEPRWGDPLRNAWNEGLHVLRRYASDLPPAVLSRVDAALQRADARLRLIEALHAMPPSPSWSTVPQLAQDTLDGLSAMTRRLVADGDPRELASWLLALDGQLAARLDSWFAHDCPPQDDTAADTLDTAARVLQTLEPWFRAALPDIPYDRALSLDLLMHLLPLLGPSLDATLTALDAYLRTHWPLVRRTVREYAGETSRRYVLLAQPDGLLVLYLLDRDAFALRTRWAERYPSAFLDAVADVWGHPAPDA